MFAREIPDGDKSDTHNAHYPTASAEDFITKIELGEPEGDEDPHQFIVNIAVSSKKELPPNFPYQFAVLLEGEFRIDHDGDLGERKRLVVINGASMLFGVIREQILSLTLRHKNGPLMLPSLDLRSLGPQRREATEKESSSRPAKTRKVKKTAADDAS